MAPFRPPWWLRGPHLQTLYAALIAPTPRPRLRRERWDTPDGDVIDIDWLVDTADPSYPTPLVVLFHGLEGSSSSHYVRTLLAAVQRRGWRGALVHFRGCGGEPNRLPRAYHSGDAREIDWILPRFRAAQARGPVFAAGVSLGGNVLLKWAGEFSARAAELIDGACAVSAPLDLVAAGDALGRGFNRLYTWSFLRTLKRKSLDKARRFPGLLDPNAIRRARTLREFDDAVTSVLHGFVDAQDYWTRSSSMPFLRTIRVPTLVLNARDDPFLPAYALPSRRHVADCVTLEYPAYGGHVGFVRGPFPGALDWMPERVLHFFERASAEVRTGAKAMA